MRTRASSGAWSRWTRLEADGGGPISHAEPVWLPGSRLLQVRMRGAGRVHIALVAAGRSPLRPVRAPAAAPGQPSIVSRAGWGADESMRRAAPRYADTVRMVFVHHTDTPNGYAPGDVPAIIRSIYTYHVRSNGWNDIGYNFLVDAYGRVYEGRGGGIDRPVIGAHTEGFNTGSVGIAVIGNGSLAPLTEASRDALVNLIAWRLDVAHVDPLGHATMISGGSDRFAAGKSVSLRVVSGHRDANATDCPGSLIYAALDGIAAAAQATGTPKIVDASATPPGLGTNETGALVPIVFRARILGGAELDRDRARRARGPRRQHQRQRHGRELDLERPAFRRFHRRSRHAARVPHRGARCGRRERAPGARIPRRAAGRRECASALARARRDLARRRRCRRQPRDRLHALGAVGGQARRDRPRRLDGRHPGAGRPAAGGRPERALER